MRDFDNSTLWEVSGFDRVRQQTGTSGFARLTQQTVLPTSLLADLRPAGTGRAASDALEVAAACLRHREAALLYLQCDGLVWPVTLFPAHRLYHSPRDLAAASPAGLAALETLDVDVPGVRPPGHWLHERIAHADHYRPLGPLLWSLALDGPRAALLPEIAGTAAYRALKDPAAEGLPVPGALRPALDRLRRETVSLRTIGGWPGMSVERASRLLNGLYLTSALLATRAHPAARPETAAARGWASGLRQRR